MIESMLDTVCVVIGMIVMAACLVLFTLPYLLMAGVLNGIGAGTKRLLFSVALLVVTSCQTWNEQTLHQAALDCSLSKGKHRLVKMGGCRCILEEASSRWSFVEWTQREMTYLSELKEEGIVDECFKGRKW
jgi:hypothetical protein